MSIVTRIISIIMLVGLLPIANAQTLNLSWDGALIDSAQVVSNLYQLAKQGSSDAQLKLAQQFVEYDIPEFDAAALFWLSKAAQKDTEAKFLLGEFYRLGIGTEVDWSKAVKIYQELAEKKHPLALSKLAECYYFGRGIEANPKKAKQYFHEAAKGGAREATNWLAILQFAGKESADELVHYNTQTEEAEGLYQQAMKLLYKKPVKEFEIQEGMSDLKVAAGRDYVPALRELGKICEHALFGCNSIEEGCEWYKQAALLGDFYSQYHLAEIYYEGLGVEKDYAVSFAFATLAARQHQEHAIKLQEEIQEMMSEQETIEAQALLHHFENL